MKTKEERETILRTSQADKVWICYSDDPILVRKMNTRFGPGKPKGEGWEWTVPKGRISFLSLPGVPRKVPGPVPQALRARKLADGVAKEPGTE